MDLTSLKPSERIIEILHPKDGTPLGIKVSLISMDDEKMMRVRRKIQDERFRQESKGKHMKSEELEDNTELLLFTAMTGWEWYGKDVTFNGKKPEFSRASVSEVFKELPWFKKQVDEAVSDESAFFSN